MKTRKLTQLDELRIKAEERIATSPAIEHAEPPNGDMERMLHELRVHQVELEVQNEELRKARAEVESGLLKYADLYNYAPAGYLLLDRSGTIRQANPAGAEILSRQVNLVGRWIGSFISMADRSTLNVFLDLIFSSGTRQVCEVTLLNDPALRSNDYEFVLLDGICSPDGLECRVVIVDITERRMLYRVAVNTTSEGIVVQREDGSIVMCNPSAEHILGLTADQLNGRTSLDPRWRSVHEDGSPFPGDMHPAMITLKNGQPLTNVIMGVHKPEGTLTWISINTRPLIAQGSEKLYGVVASFHDITERKEMEERLHILFHHSPDPIILLDQNWVLHDVNHAYETMTGYTRADLIGMSPHDLGITMDEGAEITATMRDALLQGQTIPAYEVVLQSKNGERIAVEKNIHTVTVAGEQLYMASVRDIRPRKQAETSMRESVRMLEEVNELKSRFVSVAAHEFRTPLTTIAITVDNLKAYRKRMDEAKIDNRLQKIRNEVLHLQSIINDMLSLMSTQSLAYQLQTEMIDFDAGCHAIVLQFQENTAMSHTLLYTGTPEPVQVLIDPRLLKEAVTNLISNAVKYSAAGTTVQVTLTASNSQLALTISDQGIGIPAEDLPNLFQPFHRARNVHEVQGTGLGLSIAKNMVELHGGTIQAESTVGKGTTFTVTLPMTA